MKILILGGDGYLGWPTAMAFSKKGHEVMVVDNYLRRNLCRDLDVEPLFPVPNLLERVRLWREVTGHEIHTRIGDCCNYQFLMEVFRECRPDAIIHYAEQPSAPYSMLNHGAAELTLMNNLRGTFNIVWAMREQAPDCHLVKLGTMGEYGTPNIDIEEGWIEMEHKGRRDRFLFPRQAGSLYHTTKIQDTDLLWFYVRMWGLRVSDLMQGPVYGLSVNDEADLDQRLLPFFNYDELFGTVLNRFVVQAVAGYPLTVYGKGGQTRGYLNLRDTVACVELAVDNPADHGELRVFNQITETFTVNELADKVFRVGKERGHAVEIKSIENPRKEKEEHYYNPVYTGLKDLGLTPNYLTDEVLQGMFEIVEKHKDRIVRNRIFRGVKW
ncbi:NAD-dependent epimerase/dehydratase family protein [Desulfobacter sp. UBA2225]|uniref:NAD-dependent epimerase/dehydratase family protein n=1 Tax=Desulfobacter sp. UBA2225 TaxID=1961413 RepID=UPI00257A8F93|nr:NAD-dependent epimerase/dehydratase family protein [Desulfobacter sp. UBA2225]